jgi:two-component system cell cycle sensor histidine kinase/response regulator CckA
VPARKKSPQRKRPATRSPATDPEGALSALHRAPELWQSLFENSTDFVVIVDRDLRITYINRVVSPFSREGVVGANALDFVAAEQREAVKELLLQVFRTGAPGHQEIPVPQGPYNTTAIFGTRLLPITGAGKVVAVLVTATDITERRRAEAIQRATQRISDAALAASSLQELFAAIHGIVGELMPARNLYIALYDESSDTISFPYLVDEYDQAPPPKKPGRGLTEYVLRTGEPLLGTPEVFDELVRRGEVELIGTPSVDWLGVPLVAEGKTIGVLVVQTYAEGLRYGDTELNILRFVSTQIALAIARRRAVEALRESEERLRALESATTEAVALHDAGRILEVNDAFVRMFGYSHPSEVIGRSVLEFGAPEGNRQVMEALRTGRETPYESTGLRKDGSVFVAELTGRAAHFRGKAVRMTAIRDITARRRAEEARRASEAGYRALVDQAIFGIYRSTPGGRLLTVNPALVRMLGYDSAEEVLALDMAREVYAEPTERSRLLVEHAGADFREADVVWKRKDGRLINVRLTVRVVYAPDGEIECFESFAEDVTEKRALGEQLRQAQKMEAVGRLAGGIAHDFNNLLTAILSYVDFLLLSLGSDHPAREDAEEVRRAALKAADLTRQLLAFSRRQVLQPKLLDLNTIVVEMEKLLRRLIGEDVVLLTSLAGGLGVVRADPSQLEQVIVNLSVNARDAMPAGGTLTIETANVEAGGIHGQGRVAVAPGRYVMLRMRDTGEGMDARTQARLFEPFFTTKEQGRGTGLGLATVYGIVKQSGGYIWVDSERGKGTTFTVHLPRVEAAGTAAGPPAAHRESPRGAETILLVEDDDAVRDLCRRALVAQGYRVLEASNGEQALELAEEHGGPIHLLLTDVVMPGINGRELAERLGATRPDAALLFVSGYTEDVMVHRGAQEADIPFLQKPFTPAGLLGKVREVLDARV